jgi:hypothetical protein
MFIVVDVNLMEYAQGHVSRAISSADIALTAPT